MNGTTKEVAADTAIDLKGRTPLDARIKYPSNINESFQTGAIMDLVARLATQFVNSPAAGEIAKRIMGEVAGMSGKDSAHVAGTAVAEFAMVAAEHVLKLAEERGLIQKLDVIDGPNLLTDLDVTWSRATGAMAVEHAVGQNAYAGWKNMQQQTGGSAIVVPPAGAINLGAAGERVRRK